MSLIFIVFFPIVFGLLVGLLGRYKRIAYTVVATTCLIECIVLTLLFIKAMLFKATPFWETIQFSWIPQFGIHFDFRLDGFSWLMLLLVQSLSLLSLYTVHRIPHRNPIVALACIPIAMGILNGLFLSFDLFVFFLFWELLILPIYAMVFFSGFENRIFASTQWAVWMLLSGLCLLAAIVSMAAIYNLHSGQWSFAYETLFQNRFLFAHQTWIWLLMATAFAIKLGLFPFHVWKVELFCSAPVGGLLLGTMIKTGAYGMLRFALPLFEPIVQQWEVPWMGFGLLSLLFGALIAFSQMDTRRVLAYASVSHVGLLSIGLLVMQPDAFGACVLLMITEAISLGGILVLLHELHGVGISFWLDRTSGLFKSAPKASLLLLLLCMAALGLPGFGNFIGEITILYIGFQKATWVGYLGALGVFLGSCYFLVLLYRMLFGVSSHPDGHDLRPSSQWLYAILLLLLVACFLFPAPYLNIAYDLHSFSSLSKVEIQP